MQVLTATRARALLRAGASPTSRHGGASAAELARRVLPSACPVLDMLSRAAAPWSPDNHELWGAGARARARELIFLGHQLLARHPGLRGDGGFLDAWLHGVMPHAISRAAFRPKIRDETLVFDV